MINTGFTGKLLDRYLASGWYRMGPRMFTCRYNFYPNGFLTTVWTRLPLAGHAAPKRIRKLLRRNGARFRVEVHRARARAAEELVFRAYRATKDYDLHRTAAHYLRHDPEVPFETWQISVFDGDRLAAFSYFDRGEAALQSVCGYYDPTYERFSPGLYTMALEVEQAREWGMDYHYAGYIVPGNDIFEYKRRVGALEAFDDVAREWFPLTDLEPAELPDAVQRAALLEYDGLYRGLGRGYGLRFRPSIQIPFGREGLSWLRREQLPFCIVDDASIHQPFWAAHFYSFNHRRYFSLLCTNPSAEALDPAAVAQQLDPGTGVAVECIQYSPQPFTERHLERARQAVARANAFAENVRDFPPDDL